MTDKDLQPIGAFLDTVVAKCGEARQAEADQAAYTGNRAFYLYEALKAKLQEAFLDSCGLRVDFHPISQSVNFYKDIPQDELDAHAETGMNGGPLVLQIKLAPGKHGIVYTDMGIRTITGAWIEHTDGGASLHPDSDIGEAVGHMVSEAVRWTHGYRTAPETP